MDFLTIKEAVNKQLTKLLTTDAVLTVDIDKDKLYETYLSSFPEGTNPIFRERTVHDCNCCKTYIRAVGNVVAFIDGELKTIWDVQLNNEYQVVVDTLAELVKQHAIDGVFLHYTNKVGVDKTPDMHSDIIWDHFYSELPSKYVKPLDAIPSVIGKAKNNYEVLKRSLEEISDEAIETVLDLIKSSSIYRGEEHLNRVENLRKFKQEFNSTNNKEEYLWVTSIKLGGASSFRNSSIGTLLVDLSNGVDLETAVKSFESKVAPENYKRSSALITQAMIDRAQETIVSEGLENSLERRHAVVEDITINDVLFADRSAKSSMGVLDDLKPTKTNNVDYGKATDISIKDFIDNVVPNTESMEILVSNEHQNNFMSLIAPVYKDSKPITKWDNNFTWSYNGEITDSTMRDNVKKYGGKVDGALRFSIQWNTPDRPYMGDLDAHCITPIDEHIYYSNKKARTTGGTLDVDIIRPKGVAVENIVFSNLIRMPDGDYKFFVRNFSTETNQNGFTAEIEFNGNVLTFDHNAVVRGSSNVSVAVINKKGSVFTLKEGKPTSEIAVETYGINSKEFHKVKLLMNSPNYWECVDNPQGNKHWFFILENCINKNPVRGFYNEFLNNALHNHRKVFEVLSSKMKVPACDKQLSGLGFSSTQSKTVVIRVKGTTNRTFNVKFN